MSARSGPGPGATFTRVHDRFKASLTAEEISAFQGITIDDIWQMTENLQNEQSTRSCMQGWARIGPFIEGITRYSAVIEVFVQGKAEILAFIWVLSFIYSPLFLHYKD